MRWPWHPRSVPPNVQPVLDQLMDALCSGGAVVMNMQRNQNYSGFARWVIEIDDLVSAPMHANPMLQFQKTSFPPPLPPKKEEGLKDLGVGKDPIIGYRDFELEAVDEGYVLMSRNGIVWWPRQKLRAHCNGKFFASHDAPDEKCQCGIYAYATSRDVHLKSTDVAWGEIALWGDVLICENGYRAEFAYPLSLFLRDTGTKLIRHIRETLEASYGVPVFLVEEREGKTASEIMGEMVSAMLKEVDDETTT